MKRMKLIDIYIQEVTRRLPEKNQADIALELRSTIEDMLPENYTEEEVKEALEKLGSPVALASGYLDRPMYLIGPRYFDVYVTLLKIILPIAAAIALIVTTSENIFSYSAEDVLINSIITIIGNGIWTILNTALQAFFWITLVFAILERTEITNDQSPLTSSLKKWTPDDLNNIPSILKEKKISKHSIFGSLLAIGIFTAVYFNAVRLLGVYEQIDGKLRLIVPTFNQDVLQSYWLIVLISIAVEIILVCYKFIVGQWTMNVAVMNLVRNLVSTTVFIIIFSNTNLINPAFFKYLENLFHIPIEIGTPSLFVLIFLVVLFAILDVIQGFRKATIKSRVQ